MFLMVLKVIIAAAVISFSSWLSGKKPELAGFIMALPIGTMLALLFSYAQYQNPEASINFAKSTFLAIPMSLLFFVPFLLADKLPFGFWGIFVAGCFLLVVGYFTHMFIMKQL